MILGSLFKLVIDFIFCFVIGIVVIFVDIIDVVEFDIFIVFLLGWLFLFGVKVVNEAFVVLIFDVFEYFVKVFFGGFVEGNVIGIIDVG